MTWGHARFGGDSTKVQDQLRDVQLIQAETSTLKGFLAVPTTLDKSLVTARSWTSRPCVEVPEFKRGNSSRMVQGLQGFLSWNLWGFVATAQATADAFAVILGDGSVVTWGDASAGGDSEAVQVQWAQGPEVHPRIAFQHGDATIG